MAEINYLIVPSDYSPDNIPPNRLEQLHIEGPDEHNADIVAIKRGKEIDRMIYRKRFHMKHDAELPPVKTKRHTRETAEEVIGGEELPSLRKGTPPLFQLIYEMCDVEGGETKENIWERLEDLEWFDGVDFAGKESLSKTLNLMKDNTLITIDPDRKTYHSGPKTFDYYYDLEDEGYDIKEGPYPVVRLIRDKLSERGTMKKYDLLDLLMDWNWVINREYGKKWITHSLKKRYIRHAGQGVLEPYRGF